LLCLHLNKLWLNQVSTVLVSQRKSRCCNRTTVQPKKTKLGSQIRVYIYLHLVHRCVLLVRRFHRHSAMQPRVIWPHITPQTTVGCKWATVVRAEMEVGGKSRMVVLPRVVETGRHISKQARPSRLGVSTRSINLCAPSLSGGTWRPMARKPATMVAILCRALLVILPYTCWLKHIKSQAMPHLTRASVIGERASVNGGRFPPVVQPRLGVIGVHISGSVEDRNVPVTNISLCAQLVSQTPVCTTYRDAVTSFQGSIFRMRIVLSW